MRTALAAGLLALFSSLVVGASRVDADYQIQPIVHGGDTISGVRTLPTGGLWVSALNDRGQVVFDAETADGDALFQYSDGQLRPIRVTGRQGPIGTWSPRNVQSVRIPTTLVRMNQRGDVVFAAPVRAGRTIDGVFLWKDSSRDVQPVVLQGMPAVADTPFSSNGWWRPPALNDRGEIALAAGLPFGASVQYGIFFRGQDGRLLPAALPDQPLPGGGKLLGARFVSVNNAGVVAFTAQRFFEASSPQGSHYEGKGTLSGYMWEKGEITPVALAGSPAPGGGTITTVNGVWVNDHSRSMLVFARVNDQSGGEDVLYRWTNGSLAPVVAAGQEMPGGGKFRNIPFDLQVTATPTGISTANEAGQHAFLARLTDGRTAAYRLNPDGTLSLLLQSGTMTGLGRITSVGESRRWNGIGLNTHGQAALVVQIDNGPPTLVLLTPTVS
jgi:hypothetical protein